MANQRLVGHKAEQPSQEVQLNMSQNAVYATCLNCKRHPKYPRIAPVTRHHEGICAICGTFSEYAL